MRVGFYCVSVHKVGLMREKHLRVLCRWRYTTKCKGGLGGFFPANFYLSSFVFDGRFDVSIEMSDWIVDVTLLEWRWLGAGVLFRCLEHGLPI